MKKFRFFAFALVASALVFTTSCNGNDDDNGTPAVLAWNVVDGTLTISADGTGTVAMGDFASEDGVTTAPWAGETFTSVVITARVTSIGVNAFRGLEDLTSLTIGPDVATIGDTAFMNAGLTGALTFPNSVNAIGNSAFRFTALTGVTVNAAEIGHNAFRQIPTLANVTIGTAVVTIGNEAFRGHPDVTPMSALTSVVIPNNVTTIGTEAFRQTALTTVTISTAVTRIEEGTFRQTDLTSVVIPDAVTYIGEQAFDQINGLASITIGAGVTEIMDRGISRSLPNNTLTTVISRNPVPASFYRFNDDGTPHNTPRAFENRAAGAVLYVPAGSVAAYEAAPIWSTFTEIREIQ